MLKCWIGAFVAFLTLVSCGRSEKLPEAYGVYVSDNGAWTEVRAADNTLGREVAAEARFLIHHKIVGLASGATVELVPRRFIRNLITQNPDGSGKQVSKRESWEEAGEALIDGQVLPVEGKQEMVIFRPREPLKPGVYGIRALGKELETVTVSMKDKLQLQSILASNFCYDKIQTVAFGIPMGVPPRVVACSGSAVPHVPTQVQANSRPDVAPEVIPVCTKTTITVGSPNEVKQVARRLAFDNAATSVLSKATMDDTLSDTTRHGFDRALFARRFDKLLDTAAASGKLMPDLGPVQVQPMNGASCRKVSNTRPELFCTAGYLLIDGPQELRGPLGFVVEHTKTSGWTCKAFWYPLNQQVPSAIMGTDKDYQEAGGSWESIPSSNPYKVWGEKNRCLWDPGFANKDASCN